MRRSDGRMLAGIGVGISTRTGIDVTFVRVGLVLFGLLSGVGIAAYVLGWLLLAPDDDSGVIGAKATTDRRGITVVIALVPVVILVLAAISEVHAGALGPLSAPTAVAAMGLVFVWRDGSPADRAGLRRVFEPFAQLNPDSLRSRRLLLARLAIGVIVALGAGFDFTTGHHPGSWLRPLGGVALVLAAVVIVFGPWWLSVARDLVVERQARLVAEERAEMAARVHDSVLQTLAMIQRNAGQPQRVAQLARAQERELRAWLFEGDMPGSFGPSGNGNGPGVGARAGVERITVAGAIRRIQEEVEAAHGIRVETVVVGDCPLTDDLEALLAAGREATVNAAKWSGADAVSLFVEVEAQTVSLFVRDRGKGFDPGAVPRDRRGVSESVRGRVTRHGGTAVVRSAPGAGTEWELTMARRAGSSVR